MVDRLKTLSSSDRCLILEDFDAPMVDWKNVMAELSENSFEQTVVDAAITYVLKKHMKEATWCDMEFK
ncbi:unnamed protein product [Schistosoma mattheei]|uniref:Uncharacterized protein n=1 Tax=Schistosoma mattheei TaxID=31246 RepID=A0A183PXX6_9TREM|nr:unnamed protein product [Schistosoma mattheei]